MELKNMVYEATKRKPQPLEAIDTILRYFHSKIENNSWLMDFRIRLSDINRSPFSAHLFKISFKYLYLF